MSQHDDSSDDRTRGLPQRPSQTSLHHQALQRATGSHVPRTLTPHEWELYYEQNGVPPSHSAN
jgi:hypothetical protein